MAKVSNSRVNGTSDYQRAAPIFYYEGHEVAVVVAANSCSQSAEALPHCREDGWCVEALAAYCKVDNITTLYDAQVTREALLEAVTTAASNCKKNDYLVVYFSGYGLDAATSASMEETFVCVDSRNQSSAETLLGEAEFSDTLLKSCDPEVRIILIIDVCHPGTIVNLANQRWSGRQAVCIAGTRERRTAKESGRGGMFTHSMLMALDKLARIGHEDYSVGVLYNATLREAEDTFMAWQDISIQCTPGFAPGSMAWPLVPELGYEAPLVLGVQNKQDASKMAIQPEMLKFVKTNVIGEPVSIEEYVHHVTGADADKGLRGCTSRASRACYGPECCVQ